MNYPRRIGNLSNFNVTLRVVALRGQGPPTGQVVWKGKATSWEHAKAKALHETTCDYPSATSIKVLGF